MVLGEVWPTYSPSMSVAEHSITSDVEDEIKLKAKDCQQQLQKLGDLRTTLNEQRSYLLHISQSFHSLAKAAVDGTYNNSCLRTSNQDMAMKSKFTPSSRTLMKALLNELINKVIITK